MRLDHLLSKEKRKRELSNLRVSKGRKLFEALFSFEDAVKQLEKGKKRIAES